MASTNNLHIDLLEAARNGSPLSVNVSDDFFKALDQDEITGGALDVTIIVAQTAGDFFRIDYTLAGKVRVACDRCLDDLDLGIATSDSVKVYYGDAPLTGDEDVRELPAGSNVYDLSWDIYEIAESSLPLMRTHEEGDCNTEMMEKLLRHTARQEHEE